MKGVFIVIEGPDGSGKSTMSEGIAKHYLSKGVDVLHTREPGGTKISEKIRTLLLSKDNREMHPRTEALLYAASRAQHVEEVILPALNAGKMVVCERFVFSSLVYQGLCRKLGIVPVEAINDFATGGLSADVTLYLDSAELSSLARISDREADRLESDEKIRASVEENYRILANNRADQLIRIDASKEKDVVLEHCIEAIEKECRKR
ncbi:MAG: dTMP kinase [Peptoniphilus sp.]|nr:dTMP kinase [Peptoniphilus sp.]MDD7363158.1 dTMP kinase [Bacillota bacterium]MDY6044518.1 dTMP kinase [Peptoniphilus sp.]